jgi:hypothetical protein
MGETPEMRACASKEASEPPAIKYFFSFSKPLADYCVISRYPE